MNPSLNNPIIAMTTFLSPAFSLLSGIATFLERALDSVPEPVQLFQHLLVATAVSDLKLKLEELLNILMLFGFLYGTVRIIGGAGQIQRGDSEQGKMSIISGALIAAAPLIMRILFEIFFNSSAALF